MVKESAEMQEAFNDFSLGFDAFHAKFFSISDEDLGRFLIKQASESQQYLDHSAGLVQAWGNKGRELIESLVQSDVSEVRKSGLTLLGELGHPKSTAIIIEALGAWEENIREEAKNALIRFVDRASSLALATALETNADWRIRKGIAEVIHDVVDDVEQLTEKFGNRATQDLIAGLRQNLKYKEPRVQVACAKALGHLRIEEARSDLQKIATAKTKNVNVAGVEALIELGGKASLKFLNELIEQRKRDVPVKVAAISGIGKLTTDNKTGQQNLIKLRNDKSPEVRKKLAWALTRYPTSESIEVLVKMLGDPDELVRKEATASIITFGQTVKKLLLRELFNKKATKKFQSHIRKSALDVLAEMDMSEYIMDLVDEGMIEDADAEVRRSILSKISLAPQSDYQKIGKILQKRAKKEKNNDVLAELALQLRKFLGPKAEKPLVRILQNKKTSHEARSHAANELVELNWSPKKEKESITFAIARGDWEGVERVSSRGAINYITGLLSNDDPKIRLAILDAVYRIKVKSFSRRRRRKILKKVRQISNKDEEEIRVKAIPLLGYLRDNKSTKRLNKFWKKGSDEIRLSVIDAYDRWNAKVGTVGLITLLPTASDEELPKIS
ncbi:MAG: HEAT repeat domain-containing protein, partial [Candidatus Heimdallarchaeota archaeon]|nr:HEAT repeat domain-containing protein [Candidatus Heimdallarchaeota archaeon]